MLTFSGNGESVTCFWCGVVSSSWSRNEDPWERHARSSITCQHVRNEMGSDFIDQTIGRIGLYSGNCSNNHTTSRIQVLNKICIHYCQFLYVSKPNLACSPIGYTHGLLFLGKSIYGTWTPSICLINCLAMNTKCASGLCHLPIPKIKAIDGVNLLACYSHFGSCLEQSATFPNTPWCYLIGIWLRGERPIVVEWIIRLW